MCEAIKTEEITDKKIYSHIYNKVYDEEKKKQVNKQSDSYGEYELPVKEKNRWKKKYIKKKNNLLCKLSIFLLFHIMFNNLFLLTLIILINNKNLLFLFNVLN